MNASPHVVRVVLAATAGFSMCIAVPQSAAQAVIQAVPISPQGAPSRDRVPSPRTGTGTIRGRVVDAVSGTPIARARIRLQMGGVPRPATLTDVDGVFTFTKLPPGPFTIIAEKSTYLNEIYPVRGRTVRSGQRALVALADGETKDVLVKMYHGSVIAGRVLDTHGDPVERASLTALRVTSGGRPPEPSGGPPAQSNDLGEFRIARLLPGTYLLRVSPGRTYSRDGSVPLEDVPLPMPTYYPAVLSPDEAQTITLERGQSVTGIDVVIAEGIPTVVTGVVVRRDGEPVQRGAFVHSRPASNRLMFDGGSSAVVRPDGTFKLQLHPGEYILEAQVPPEGPSPPAKQESGRARVSVGAGPIDSVTILVGPLATASGRVVFEGTTPAPPPLKDPVHVPLFSSEGACHNGQARVAPDWTFRVEELSGTCSAPPQLTFGRWTLKAVLKGGQDILDRPLTFEPGQHLDGLQLVFTDRRTELLFRVTDERGESTREYVVLVYPTDKASWTNDEMQIAHVYAPPTPEMLQMRSRAGGEGPPTSVVASMQREALTLSPGDYYVVAVDDIAHEDTRSPQVLERLAASATRVTLAEGAQQEVGLRRLELAQVVR